MRLTGTEVRVEVTPPGPTQVDGDVFGAAALEARLHPGGLLVIGRDRRNVHGRPAAIRRRGP